MTQKQAQRPVSPLKAETDDALSDTELGQVSGGTDATPSSTSVSTTLKTKHDTVKNSISNIR